MSQIEQVQDAPEILAAMNQDMQAASDLYRPTNYWEFYRKSFQPELDQQGLHDFRRRKGSILYSFGANDLIERRLFDAQKVRLIHNKFTTKIPGWKGVENLISSIGSGFISLFPEWKKKIWERPFYYAQQVGKDLGAPPLENIDLPTIGNPEERIEVNGKTYTSSMLYYYMRYAYAQKYIDLNKVQTVVELGSGSGKNIVYLKKLHPHLTILLFDISPQLYVCEQFLKSVFPGQVVSYADNRDRTDLNNLEPGKIHVFGSWHMPLLAGQQFDVFWNCASFQEMEPHVVLNYLSFVQQSVKQVYLMAKMDGKEQASDEGTKGVLNPVKFEHYQEGLKGFSMIDKHVCYLPSGERMWEGYEESVWKKD